MQKNRSDKSQRAIVAFKSSIMQVSRKQNLAPNIFLKHVQQSMLRSKQQP